MDKFTFTVLLLVFLNPCAIAATVGLWLTLLGWAWNSILIKWSFLAPIAQRVPSRAIPVVSLVGAAGTLANHWLGLLTGVNIPLIPLTLLSPNYKTSAALLDWWYVVPRVWLALAVVGPLVLLVYFGSTLILTILNITTYQHRRITKWTVSTLLLVGIVTGLVGFGWPIWTAFVNPDGLQSSLDIDYSLAPLLAPFCPINSILAIALSYWLVKADNDQRVGVAVSAATVVLIALAMLVAWITGTRLVEAYARMDRW